MVLISTSLPGWKGCNLLVVSRSTLRCAYSSKDPVADRLMETTPYM